MTILLAYVAGTAVVLGVLATVAGALIGAYDGQTRPYAWAAACTSATILAGVSVPAGLWHVTVLATVAAGCLAWMTVDAARAARRRRTAQHMYLPRHTAARRNR